MPAGIPVTAFQAFYSSFFADASHDVFNGDYTSAMLPYDVPLQGNANLLSPEQVKTLVVGARAQRVPTAFLLYHGGRLHIYLQVDKFHPRLGMPPSPWDDKLFAQKGDLHRNQAVLVEWKSEYFHQLNQQLLVPMPGTIDAILAGQPDVELLGPYAQGEAGTELIKVRRTCFVPPKYIGMFLGEPLTPREAWERVRGQIVIDGNEASCHALVKYLQAALTQPAAGEEPLLSLTEAPTAPLADALLLEHRRRILCEDFPELGLEANGHQQEDQIAVSIGELVRDNQAAREEARQEKQREKAKGVEDMLGETGVQKLLRWSQVEAVTEVQDIWRDLAKAKKAQQLGVLQWAIDRTKEEFGEGELQFIVTPAVLEVIKSLRFAMVTNDHVSTGLQPFLFPEEAVEGALNSKALYEAMYEGSNAPPLSEFAVVMQAKP
ncbi:CvfB_WH domain-containing protein (Fragment), partial [Durusdinium trenchii]